MTNLPPDLNSPVLTSASDAPLNSSPRKRAIIAGLLSLLLPGMGQLYNRQPRKALGIAIITHILGALVAHTRLLLNFWTMIASILIVFAWQLFVAIEAARSAAAAKRPESPVPLPRLAYPLIGIIIVFGALAPSPQHTMHESGFYAYKIPSASMCPTICAGDRIVADAWAYHLSSPKRGDLVMLKFPSSDALFIKRVIGLPGDLVAPGPGGSVLVNGKPFQPPKACGNVVSIEFRLDGDSSAMFKATKVPEGTFYVVGDNLGEIIDGRIPDFGPATLDMLRGKPLYFYWSPNRNRIACSIH